MPPLTLDGTTGVSAVQTGSIQSDDLAAGVGGKVLQVVNQKSDFKTTTSTTNVWVNTALTIPITPSSNSSKIFVVSNYTIIFVGAARMRGGIRLTRDGSVVSGGYQPECIGIRELAGGSEEWLTQGSMNILDSPNTISEVTYTIDISLNLGSSMALREDGGSFPVPGHIIAMEIAG